MGKTSAKIYLSIFSAASAAWLYAVTMTGIDSASLLVFGTTEFKSGLDPATELSVFRSIAENAIVGFISYPLAILGGLGYIMTTDRSFKRNGWLLMCTILVVIFIPVELYCFWYDWTLVGLTYWGEGPQEEFRKAFISRLTALSGLPLIARLCYFTIPFFIIFKPFTNTSE